MKCFMSNRFKVTHNESINETLLWRDLYHWTMHDPVLWWIQSKEFADDHKALGNIYILMKRVKPLSFSDLRPVVKTLKSNKHINANQLYRHKRWVHRTFLFYFWEDLVCNLCIKTNYEMYLRKVLIVPFYYPRIRRIGILATVIKIKKYRLKIQLISLKFKFMSISDLCIVKITEGRQI